MKIMQRNGLPRPPKTTRLWEKERTRASDYAEGTAHAAGLAALAAGALGSAGYRIPALGLSVAAGTLAVGAAYYDSRSEHNDGFSMRGGVKGALAGGVVLGLPAVAAAAYGPLAAAGVVGVEALLLGAFVSRDSREASETLLILRDRTI